MIRRSFFGVSLLEVLIAFTIIVLVLLSLLGAVSFSLEGTRAAEGRLDASWIAQRTFENIRDRKLIAPGFQDPVSARIPINAVPFESDFPANTGFTRRLVTERLSTDPTNYRSHLYQIDVSIFWENKRRENVYTLKGLYRES